MKTLHLLFILGTRPEAIKLAPVILAAKKNPAFKVTVCSTGQHKEMIKPILNFFHIQPDFQLDVMTANQGLAQLSAAILQSFTGVLAQLKQSHQLPDWVLVQGDTTTAMMAALVGFYEKVKIAHIEAGLRTDTIYSPWPEELNRRVIGLMADAHFAPTPEALQNLQGENKKAHEIFMTGNTGIDALKTVSQYLESDSQVKGEFDRKFSFLNPQSRFILATVHRRENFGQPMENIFHALREVSEMPGVEVLIPVHMNPQVRATVSQVYGESARWMKDAKGSSSARSKIWLCDPLEYLDFVYLMKRSYLMISDSGGVQEEAPCLGKPVLVVRESTERPEAVTAGANMLVGTEKSTIVQKAQRLFEDQKLYAQMAEPRDVYGDGQASQRILQALLGWEKTQ